MILQGLLCAMLTANEYNVYDLVYVICIDDFSCRFFIGKFALNFYSFLPQVGLTNRYAANTGHVTQVWQVCANSRWMVP